MAGNEMKAKSFTIKDANRLVPGLKTTFDEIFVIKKKIAFLKSEMDWLRDFWTGGLRDSDNPDSDKYDDIAAEIERLYNDITYKVLKMQGKGCIVKDVDAGLVDFYSEVDGRVAFLCWKYGEKEIQYWHTVEGGFRGRQPIGNVRKNEKDLF